MALPGANLPTVTVTPPCPCCGGPGNDARPISNARPQLFRSACTFTVSRCRGCGALFTSPRLSDEGLRAWYDALQALPQTTETLQRADSKSVSPLVRFLRCSERATPVARWMRGGPVLDLGCGQEQLLSEVASQGFEAEGVEWDAAAVVIARGRGEQADLRTFEPSPARYQHIVLSNVLEHLPDPAGQLQRIAPGLGAVGTVLVAVPNAASALRFVFGRHWVGWDVPFHLTHFTPASMRAMASLAGLCAARTRTPGTAEEIRTSLNNALATDRRMLARRVAFFPIARALGALRLRSALVAELEPTPPSGAEDEGRL